MNFYKLTTIVLTAILLANSFVPTLLPDTARAATNTLNCITVGAGLKPGGQQCADFTLAVKFTPKSTEHGTADTAARGDHNHDSRYWMLTGNTATTPGTNFLGTTDAQPFVLKTNGVERVRVTGDGKVGVGTSNPQSALTVVGTTNAGLDVKGLKYGGIFTATNTAGASVGVKGSGAQYGVFGSSSNGNAVFGGNNSTSTAAVAGLNAGSGPGVSGLSVSGNGVEGTSQGSGFGVLGRQQGGSGVTTGVAAVWGDSNSNAGVYATSNTGTGLFATSNSGTAIYGHSTNGTAIKADGNGASTAALEIGNGALKVSGPGLMRTAFVVRAKESGYSSVLIHSPLTDGDPNALVFITVNRTADSNGPYDIDYRTDCACWEIHNALNNSIPVDMRFNVLVIKR